MRDIDEMFKDILEDNNKQNMFDNDSWVILLMILALINNSNFDKDQPIINIFLGDE